MIFCVIFDAGTGARIGYIRGRCRNGGELRPLGHFRGERDDMITGDIKMARRYTSAEQAREDAKWIEGTSARAVHREPAQKPVDASPEWVSQFLPAMR